MSVRKLWLCCLTVALLVFNLQSRATPVIRVGINSSYAPFESVDDRGRLAGFDIDLVNAWARTQGVAIKFVNLPWPRLLESLEAGRVDMVVSAVAISPERLRRFDFSRPYFQEPQVLLLPVASRREEPKTLAAVGVLAGSSGIDWLARQGVRPAAMKLFDGVPPMVAALKAGDIDGAFGDLHALRRAAAHEASLRMVIRPQYGRDDYAFVVKKGNRALLERANRGLEALEARGGIERLRRAYPGL
jgi:polar amino acid transport system substrate-binding protein